MVHVDCQHLRSHRLLLEELNEALPVMSDVVDIGLWGD